MKWYGGPATVLRHPLCVLSLLIELRSSRRMGHSPVDRNHILIASTLLRYVESHHVSRQPFLDGALSHGLYPQDPANLLHIGHCIQPVSSHSYSFLLIASNAGSPRHLKLAPRYYQRFATANLAPVNFVGPQNGLRCTCRRVGRTTGQRP